MKNHDEECIRQELLELHFGCHEDPDGLKARLEREPELAALYEELRAEADLLGDAARAEAPALDLSPPWTGQREGAVESRRRWRPSLRVAAGIAFALFAAGPMVPWGVAAIERDRLEEEVLRLVVAGPPGLPDRAGARYRVETWNLRGEPQPARVVWRLFDGEGVELSSHFQQSEGAFSFDVSAMLSGVRRLEVTATTDFGEETASLELSPTAGAPLAHLSTDKPAYRPGETVLLRAVLLDRISLEPSSGAYRLRVFDTKENSVAELFVPAEDGVVAASWQVPADAAGGEYAFALRDAADQFTVQREPFLVRRYQAPRLAKEIDLDAKTYAPGAAGEAELFVERVEGGFASGAEVLGSLVIDGQTVWSETALLDRGGRARFRFEVPAEVERGEGRFVARVTDGGVVETQVEPFVVPTGLLEVGFYPEGGELVPGVLTRIYAEVTDTLGRPTDASGRIVDGRGRTRARFETLHQGRGSFELVAEIGERLRLEFDEPLAEAVDLPVVPERAVGLRASRESTPPGEPVRVAVHAPHAGPWLIGAFCRGVLVGEDTFSGSGLHELELELPATAAGVLRLTVFDGDLLPVAERLVHRESGREIAIEVEPASEVVVPGERQELTVVARDEAGNPVKAVLGLVVTDRAVRDYYGEDRVGLADRTWLIADVEELEDVEEFLTGDEESRRNVDLLLGTRGWRRLAWVDPEVLVAERGDEARRLLVREGRPMWPLVSDTQLDRDAVLYDAHQREEEALETAYGIWIFGGGGFFLLLGCWWLSGRMASRRFVPRLAGAGVIAAGCACAAVVLFPRLFLAENVIRSYFVPPPGADLQVAHGDVPQLAVEDPAADWRAFGEEHAAVRHLAPGANDLFMGGGARGWGQPGPPMNGAGPGAPPVILGAGPGPVQPDAGVAVRFDGLLVDGEQLFLPVQLEDLVHDELLLLEAGEMEDKVAFLRGFEMPAGEVALRDFGYLGDRELGRRSAYGGYARGAVLVREFAHQHTPNPELRSDFAETVYWNASLVTDEEGRAIVGFDTSDRVTTWSVYVDAHGGGRVGQAQAGFEARIPFRLEAKLPVELTAGDRLLIPVSFTADDPEVVLASLSAQLGGPLAFAGVVPGEVELDRGRGRALIPVIVGGDGSAGTATLWIAGSALNWTDRVSRELLVAPRGFPHSESLGGVVSDRAVFEIAMPDDFMPGSLRSTLKLYPSPLAGLQDGMEGLLRTPGGCFEQASRSNYPNALALAYLEAAGAGDAPELRAKAEAMLQTGYRLLTGYECSEQGYEWFGSDPGHEALSAYGLLEFDDMSRVFPVDQVMVDRTRDWLLTRRDGRGGFLRNSKALDSFGSAPQEVTDAYITYALVATGTEPANLELELNALQARSLESDDPYEVAAAACALWEAERFDAADAARERLKQMRAVDGSLVGTTKSITCSGGADLVVETTSFAVLAWLPDPDDAAYVAEAVDFLLSARRGDGTFGTTQATIMAMKALVAHAEENRRIASAGRVEVFVNGEPTHGLSFEAGAKGLIEFGDLARHLAPGVNRVELVLSGENEFPWSFDLAYHSDRPADNPNAVLDIEVSLGSAEVEEGQTVPLTVRVTNRAQDEGQPMTLAIVGLPAGLDVPTEVLEDLLEAERFDFWELNGRELALYWRDLAPGEVKEVHLDLVARVPGTTLGPASRGYLYYTPDAVRWAEPLEVTITAVE